MKKLVHDQNLSLKEIFYKNTLNFYSIVDAENIIIRNKNDDNFVIKIVLSEIDKNILQDVANYFNSNDKEVKSIDAFSYNYVCFAISRDTKEISAISLTEYLYFAEKEKPAAVCDTTIYDNNWEIFEMVDEKELEKLEQEIEELPKE